MFTGCYKMFNLIKYPWIADGSTTNHNTIHSIVVFIFQCFFRRINITISKNGNMNTWIIFQFANQRPVGLAFIHLCAGTSVDSESFYLLLIASLIRPSEEMNSVYIRSAPLSLHTARKGGSLTSSIGASNKGKSGNCMVPILIIHPNQLIITE